MNKSITNQFDSRIFILMFLVIIEIMGVGIVFPILPELFFNHSSIFPAVVNASNATRHILYGTSISLWALGIFFGAPYLGALSDKFGRKKIFLISLVITSCCYSLLAIAIYLKSIILFFFGRFCAGFVAGNYEIAQAAAADLSTPETKARNMGWMTFALGTGFILGPLITTFTTDQASCLSFGITTPFWIASILALINAILIANFFNETFYPKLHKEIKLQQIFFSFLFAFVDRRLVYLSIVFFILNCGWIMFFTGGPLYLTTIFHASTKQIGWFYCFNGIGSTLSILVLQKYILARITLKNIVIYACLLGALTILSLTIINSFNAISIAVIIFAVVELLAYSSLLAIYSNAVTPDEQGRAMGGTAALGSLSIIITALLAAALATINAKAPLIGGAILYIICSLLMIIRHQTKK